MRAKMNVTFCVTTWDTYTEASSVPMEIRGSTPGTGSHRVSLRAVRNAV
jgi:hypothetical protein